MSLMLTKKNATVTLCHSKTEDLAKVAREADILVVAVGVMRMVTKEFVKPGSLSSVSVLEPICMFNISIVTIIIATFPFQLLWCPHFHSHSRCCSD